MKLSAWLNWDETRRVVINVIFVAMMVSLAFVCVPLFIGVAIALYAEVLARGQEEDEALEFADGAVPGTQASECGRHEERDSD